MITVKEKHLCTGCEACSNVCPVDAISMLEDEEGFRYPHVDEHLCIQCEKCLKVCPITNTPVIGKLSDPIVFACKSNNDDIRVISSSGGIFSLIADAVLKKRGVVFGAGFDSDFSVVHMNAQNLTDLESLRRSKYVQSSIGLSYKEVEYFLDDGNIVLFSGTPCQIAGLQSFLKTPRDDLITMEVVCHGVPSSKVYRRYLSYLENSYNGEICEVNFRSKNRGWDNYSTSIHFSNGKQYSEINSIEPFFMRGFLTNLYLRPSCYDCKFKHNNSVADITVGDYWRIDRLYSHFYDKKGVSLAVVNTEKGLSIFSEIEDDMDCIQTSLEHALECNSVLNHSGQVPHNRDEFFFDLDALDYKTLMRKYCGVSPVHRWLTRAGLKPIIRKMLRR